MELLRSLTLKVELFAGTAVLDAACDLCVLAKRTGTLVEADFNGVKLRARPDDNPLKLAEAYHNQLQNKYPHKIVQARDV